jgi:hypothetical protein
MLPTPVISKQKGMLIISAITNDPSHFSNVIPGILCLSQSGRRSFDRLLNGLCLNDHLICYICLLLSCVVTEGDVLFAFHWIIVGSHWLLGM